MKMLHPIVCSRSRHRPLALAGLFPALFLGLALLEAQTPVPAPTAAIPPAVSAPPTATPAVTAPAGKAAAPRSVWEGVYSPDQLNRGKKAFNSQCARCHGENLLGGEEAPMLVEKDFLDKWLGKSVGSLIDQTRKTMPSDGPGKLSRQQCTDIAAYLLNANGFPAGKSDLPADAESLNLILIKPKNETPPNTPPSPPINPAAPAA
jgi:S-disulfanyl-L-cysteine oxidoreductase SoxD